MCISYLLFFSYTFLYTCGQRNRHFQLVAAQDRMAQPRRLLAPSVTITIIEQPEKTVRFRYQSEIERNRTFTSIKGASCSESIRTYPTIQVHGYEGPLLIRLSLVNAWNGLVHPHSLKSSNKHYICSNGTISCFANKPDVEFRDLIIVCVKGKSTGDITKALENRRYDPLGAGFTHKNNHRLIDFFAVRLCFQVFLPRKNCTQDELRVQENYDVALPAVTSSVIYDEKKHGDLKIVYFAGPVLGGREMQLWCKKYTGADPDVVFYDGVGWSEKACNVLSHQKAAMRFEPPRHKQPEPTCAAIKVEVRLQQTNKSRQLIRSNPVYAEYTWSQPRLISPGYLPLKNAKNVDEQIEQCRAILQSSSQIKQCSPRNRGSWEGLYAMPSTSRASVSSDQVRSLPDSGFMSPTNDDAAPNTDHLMSTNDLEYGSNVDLFDLSCEELRSLTKEQQKSVLAFDESLL